MKKHKPVKDRCCMNPDCLLNGLFGKGNIIRHSFYKTSQGRRRRYLCKACNKTFCSTAGTPYYRLHKSRSAFDEVARSRGASWSPPKPMSLPMISKAMPSISPPAIPGTLKPTAGFSKSTIRDSKKPLPTRW